MATSTGKRIGKVFAGSATINGAAVGCNDELWYQSEVIAIRIMYRDLFTSQLTTSTVILDGVIKIEKEYNERMHSVYGGALGVRAMVRKSDVTNQLPPLATVTMLDTDGDLAEHLVSLGMATRYRHKPKQDTLPG